MIPKHLLRKGETHTRSKANICYSTTWMLSVPMMGALLSRRMPIEPACLAWFPYSEHFSVSGRRFSLQASLLSMFQNPSRINKWQKRFFFEWADFCFRAKWTERKTLEKSFFFKAPIFFREPKIKNANLSRRSLHSAPTRVSAAYLLVFRAHLGSCSTWGIESRTVIDTEHRPNKPKNSHRRQSWV